MDRSDLPDQPTPNLSPPAHRPLTSLDLLGLVVAVAIGLGAWLLDRRGSSLIYKKVSQPIPQDWEGWFRFATIQLVALAGLVVARSLWWPRSEQRQPGIAGCWGAVIVLMTLVVQDASDNYLYAQGYSGALPFWELLAYHAISVLGTPAALAGGVLFAWWVAAGRSERGLHASGTLNRLGLAVGAALVMGCAGWSITKLVWAYQFYN